MSPRFGVLGFLAALLVSVGLVAAAADASLSVSINGTKFFNAEGDQFFVKGVIYTNVDVPDVLGDPDQCQIDAALMNAIGINTVRVYSIDATKNHTGCMNAFRSQGIYVWIDLPTLGSTPKWTPSVFTEWSATVDMFSGYSNTLIYGISIEPPNNGSQPGYLPQVKAAVRDIKTFQNERGYRQIPVSYGAVDDPLTRIDVADYLTCGNQGTTIDIYGLNVWSWCTNSSYHESGYDKLFGQFQHMDIPVVISESGCGEDARDFADVATMFGPIFETVFSGTVVYQWLNTTGSDGFVNYESGQNLPTTLSNYDVLSTVLSSVVPSSTALSAYTPTNSAPACPTTDSDWTLAGSVSLPTLSSVEISTVSRLTTRTTDSATLSTSSSSATDSVTTTSAAGAEALSSATGITDPDAQRQAQQASLSTGAIAGIAIGGAVVGIALAVGGIFFCWRRKKSARETNAKDGVPGSRHGEDQYPLQEYTDDDAHSGAAELHAKSSGPMAYAQELDARSYHSAVKPHEMIHEAQDSPLHELPPHGHGPMHELASPTNYKEIDGRPVISELASPRS